MNTDEKKTKAELITELNELRKQVIGTKSAFQTCADDLEDGTFRKVIDDLPQIVYELDLTGRITYANTFALKAFGYTQEDIETGLNVSQVIHPDSLPVAMKNVARTIMGEGSLGEEYIALRKEGTPFYIKVYSQQIVKEGKPIGVRGVASDISDIKQTEEALRESENYYRTLFDNTGTAMLIFDQDSVIQSCNTKCADLSGYSAKEVEGVMKWTDFVEPEDLIRMIAYQTKREQAPTDIPSEYEFTLVTRDGTHKRVQNFVKVIPETKDRVCSLIDITDKKKAELALRESETYYRALFENTGTAMVIFGEDSIIRSCNSQFEILSGFPAKEIEGKKKWSDFVDPEDLKRMSNYHKARLQKDSKAPSSYEFTFLAHGGERKQVHVTTQIIPDTEDRACSLIDITARTQVELALRKSEERYELVVRGANDGIWDWDLITNAVYYSPRYKAILGYTDEEFPNVIESWKNTVHPDDLAHTVAANMKCIEGEVDHFQIEFRMRHKDDSYRWILGRGASSKNEQGKVYRLAGTHTDITDRKISERTMHALYAISKAISTTRDLQDLYETIHTILGEVIDATNFFIAMLDEKEDRIIFTYFEDEKDDYYDIRNVSSPDTKSLTVHVITTGKPLFLSQAREYPSDIADKIGVVGSPAAVWIGVPLKLGSRVIGAMAVQHYTNPHHYTDSDVSLMETVAEQVALAIERKTNEEALTQLNEELESKVDQRTLEINEKAIELEAANTRLKDLDKIKSSLVSSISHELRTPLTSIRGFAKLTGKDFVRFFQPLADDDILMNKGERIRQNLKIIETEGERLTRLINDFLDINRIESGKAAWNDSFLNPCDVIRQASEALAGSFAAKPEVTLMTDLPETIPPIHADPDKVQQVLINLLNNACKFTNEGSVIVSATANIDTLTISVSDTGMGIPHDELSYIFEKFHKSRLGDTINTKDKGTGLGLAICKEIVEHYGGSIWVESTIDQGSIFSFTLPSVPGTETACA